MGSQSGLGQVQDVGMKDFSFCFQAIACFGYIAYVRYLIVGVLSFLEAVNAQPHFNPISF